MKRRRRVGRDALISLVAAFVLVAAKEWIDTTDAGEHLQLASFAWIQRHLTSLEEDAPLPIAILDLSDLSTKPIEGARKGEEATPRAALETLIRTLLDHQPQAIGVDVDFGPEQDGRVLVTPRDREFFESCLSLSRERGIPIYLGVARTALLSRDRWLWRDEYRDLAANILVPRFEVTQMVRCMHVNGGDCNDYGLAALLAKQLDRLVEKPAPPLAARFPHLFTSLSDKRLSGDLSLGLFPIDYGRLASLMSSTHTFASSDPQMVAGSGDFFHKKIVLLGDVKRAQDTFIVPGSPEPVPGVYLHASAIYTLSQAPLYLWTEPWLVDLCLAAIIIGVIAGIRLYYNSRTTDDVAVDRLQGFLTVGFALVVIVIGVGLVQRHRVLWTDFTLVLFALFMHPRVERYAHAAWTAAKRVPRAWHRLLFDRGRG